MRRHAEDSIPRKYNAVQTPDLSNQSLRLDQGGQVPYSQATTVRRDRKLPNVAFCGTTLKLGLITATEFDTALAECRAHLATPGTAFTMYTVARSGVAPLVGRQEVRLRG